MPVEHCRHDHRLHIGGRRNQQAATGPDKRREGVPGATLETARREEHDRRVLPKLFRAEGRRRNDACVNPLVTAIRDPENKKALIANGAEPIGSTPEEHAAAMKSEIEKWKKVARDAKIEAQ